MDAVLLALQMVASPTVLLAMLLSGIFGMFVGAVPGLTATMATALLVPITFFLPPVPATSPGRCCAFPARPLRRPTPTSPTR